MRLAQYCELSRSKISGSRFILKILDQRPQEEARVSGIGNSRIGMEEHLVKRGKENTMFPLLDPNILIFFLKEAKAGFSNPVASLVSLAVRISQKVRRKFWSRVWEDWDSKIPHPLTWEEIMEKVLERDNNICQMCGKTNLQYKGQEVAQITPLSMGGDNFDFKNLQTLCHECHGEKHSVPSNGN